MNKMKKVISLFIALFIVIGILPVNMIEAVDEGITLTHEQVPSKLQNPQEFLTGELMQSVLTLKANLPSSEFTGAYIELSIPAEVANFVESIDALIPDNSEVFEQEIKVSSTTWKIPIIASDDAREVQVPILTKFTTFLTPDKTVLPLTIALKKADGSIVKSDESVTFIGKAGNADYTMSVRGGQHQIGGLIADGTNLGTTGLVDVVFDYETYVKSLKDPYRTPYDGDYGQRIFDTITLTQPLPPFAVFDAAKNPNWQYDANTNVATYILNAKDYNDIESYNPVSLRLTFPGAALDTNYSATSTMVFHPANQGPNEETITVSKTVYYIFKHEAQNGMPFEKHFAFENEDTMSQGYYRSVSNVSSRLSKGLKWRIGVSNVNSETIVFNEFKDYGLDPRLYYTGVSLPRSDAYVLDDLRNVSYVRVSNVTVKGLLDDGSIQTLGTVSSGGTLNFSSTIARRIKEVYFEFPNGFTLPYMQRISFTINTAPRNPLTVSVLESENLYHNSGSYKATYTRANGTSYEFTGEDTTRFLLIEPRPDFGVKKNLSDKLGTGWFSPTRDEHTRSDDEYAIWTIEAPYTAVRGLSDSSVLTNVEFIDLLPEGVTYVGYRLNGPWGVPAPTVTYVPDYSGSGINAVVVKWSRITVSQLNRYMDYSDPIQIQTKVNSNSTPGQNNNTVLVKYNGEFISFNETNHMDYGFPYQYVDTRDIDQDGNTSEVFSATRDYYEYTGRLEVLARKYIARDTVDNWTKDGLKTGVDAPFRYKLWNYNNLLTDVTSYEILDVLPHVNDHSTATDAITNTLVPRNSKFSNTLTGPVTFISNNASKFNVEYSTDPITGPVDQSNNTLNWTSTVADYSQVTAIRISLKQGQIFRRGELLEVVVPMKAPSVGTLGDRAYNNFSIATNSKQPTPTNLVWNEIYIPSSPLKIIKKSDNGTLLSGGVFTITSKADPTIQYEVTTTNGVVEQVLPLGDYEVVEKTAPVGYELDPTIRNVSIIEDEVTTLEVVNNPYINVKVEKIWEDEKNQDGKRPSEITVNLLRNNEIIATEKITVESNWTHTFENLSKYKEGVPIVYTITEEPVTGYTSEVNGYTITNRYTPETINIPVRKIWEDGNDQDRKRPESIDVTLLANDEEVSSTSIRVYDNWEYTFENFPKYKDGKEIVYRVVEGPVAGYTSEVNGFNITNRYTPETINVSVTKTWEDASNQDGKRPQEIIVHLHRDGELFTSGVINEKENWKFTFENLPKYEDGQEIVYTVTEEPVEGYETEINGLTITNRHIPETISIPVEKIWDDQNNQDGKRPTEITVNVLSNNGVVASAKLTEQSDWKHTFENLPKYKDGQEIVYTIEEVPVLGYTSEVNGFTITNGYTPEIISLSVTKTWEDSNNQDGKRPSEITVNLLSNGDIIATEKITAESNWVHTFENLPKYKDGKEIVYTVTEEVVEGYTSEVNGLIITNKAVPKIPVEPNVPVKPPVEKPKLPNTGSLNHQMIILGGVGLLLLGLAHLFLSKKEN